MKVLQLDVDRISYRLVKPEASVYEQAEPGSEEVRDALVVMLAIEKGDDENAAKRATEDFVGFAKRQKLGRIVIYPFAHLSNRLENPSEAMRLFSSMEKMARESFGGTVTHAPFGWNKQLSLEIKGHPLAEQSRSYGTEGVEAPPGAKRKERVDLSILKKSDWAGLPQNDHRTLGEQLDLYSGQEISPGMIYWHPNGLIVYEELKRFLREKYYDYGYKELSTPTLANIALWHVSGHWQHYKDNMFLLDYESGEIGLKPMNCPATIMIYKARKWSYKELPFRTAIFDRLYRKELSGTLGGLMRVQEFSQDDGHIFAAEEQLESEMKLLLKLVKGVYSTFGLEYSAKLSTKDPNNYMGDDALWEHATKALEEALKSNGIKYGIKEGDAAFYGPKIDFHIVDSAKREWQCGTIQLDYNMPKNFKITYTGEDGKEHMPIMIHRAILGSVERFLGVMIEHFQGKFPTWLAPVQAIVLSISESNAGYANAVYGEFRKARIRVELDASDRTLEYKIRDAQMRKIPYMIVLGKREEEAGQITARSRSGKQKQGIKASEFIAMMKNEIEGRMLEQPF